MLFWVRNLPLFSGSCKWDVTRYIYNLGIFSSIFNIFQFLHYSKRQQSYFLLNCNHQRSKMTSLKTICPLLIKIFSNISEQPWMGVMIMLQVLMIWNLRILILKSRNIYCLLPEFEVCTKSYSQRFFWSDLSL